ncbi:MAG: DUF4309 domain-containing protein [Planifilum fulgidum]
MKRWIQGLAISMLTLLALAAPAFASEPPTSDLAPDILVRQIMGLAFESQQSINSVPFAAGDSLKKVIKKWGPPEDISTVAANYWSRNVRFIYDGSTGRKTIVAIEDFGPQLKTIHLSDVKGLIGNPDSEKEQEGNYYVTYSDGENYTVTFVFESAFDNSNPSLTMYILEKPGLELKQK